MPITRGNSKLSTCSTQKEDEEVMYFSYCEDFQKRKPEGTANLRDENICVKWFAHSPERVFFLKSKSIKFEDVPLDKSVQICPLPSPAATNICQEMEQLKFPLDQLGKHLRCSDCRNLLSVPPVIVLKDTGKYKCGRCCLAGRDGTGRDYPRRTHPQTPVHKAADAVRDLLYEELAKDLLFPCKNLKYSCAYYYTFHSLVEVWTNDMHDTFCSCDLFLCSCQRLAGRHNPMSYSSYVKHLQSEHREESCEKKWHSHVVTIAKDSEGDNERHFYSSDNKIVFLLRVVKKGREFTFSVRSLGTERLFQFEIKPGKFTNNKSKRGEILWSHTSVLTTSYQSVKLVLLPEDDDEGVEQYEFQLDYVGSVKPEELVKIPVKDSDALRCTKCDKYLSVKPVMATKYGFECGRCFTKKSEGDKVRMKAYEILAEMVVFPCEEPGCEKSFGIAEMKKHWDSHKSSEIFQNVYAKKSKNGACSEVGHIY